VNVPRPLRSKVIAGATAAVLAAPLAAALTALVWEWPVFMVGTEGGTPRSAFGAAFTAILYLVAGGVVVLGGLGAGAGYLLRHQAIGAAIAAGTLVALCAAVGVAYVNDLLRIGPGWIYVHVGGFDDHQATLGGQARIVEAPAVGVDVIIRGEAGESTTTTGSQGWAMLRVPKGEYTVATRCGEQQVEVRPDDNLVVSFYCT